MSLDYGELLCREGSFFLKDLFGDRELAYIMKQTRKDKGIGILLVEAEPLREYRAYYGYIKSVNECDIIQVADAHQHIEELSVTGNSTVNIGNVAEKGIGIKIFAGSHERTHSVFHGV